MATTEGFAQPWLNFEKHIGKRLLLHGPTLSEATEQYLGFGSVLVSKLTIPPPDSSIATSDKEIFSGVKARIYTPPNYIPGSKPPCIFVHGGGWTMGNLDSEDASCRKVSKDVEIVVVSIDYRLAPKHPFPTPLDDCVESCYWVLENSDFLGTNPGKIIISGSSAGANLALAAALKIIDAGKRHVLGGVVALAPPTIVPEAIPRSLKERYTSYDRNSLNTINTTSAMKLFYDAYGANPSDPYVSVLLHPKLKDLPPVYMAVCTQDTLRDDGRLFRDALDLACVKNMYHEYEGYPHFFWGYPSEHLAAPISLFYSNLSEGFQFILGSQ